LGLTRRLKALQAPLALTQGLMRVLRTVVQIPMLAMLHAREDLALGSPLALHLVVTITRGT
jgi:hypothetical protein